MWTGWLGATQRGLTLELTPRAEAGGVSLVRDDAPSAADQAYDGCRSASGVERPVRPHRAVLAEHGGGLTPTAPPAYGAAVGREGRARLLTAPSEAAAG